MKKFFAHPLTQRTRLVLRRTVITASVILAVTFVLTASVDLGPALKGYAERGASAYLDRAVTIGRMRIVLWNGRYEFDDFVIGGRPDWPDSPPFLVAKRISVSMLWSTLAQKRVVFDDIDMSDWKMQVESGPRGHSFPRFGDGGPRGERTWTVTMAHVRAHRGEFVYDDTSTPWSVIARNIDVTVGRTTTEYVGTAKFSNGLVDIQDYVPFRADMDTRFRLDGGRVILDPINLTTDGAKTVLKGDVNFNHWPEQMFSMTSEIDLRRMRELFFADDEFTLSGTGHFDGVFHLFKDFNADGTERTGRELKGTFTSALAGVNTLRFEDLAGLVRWVPESLTFTEANTRLFGGAARMNYRMAPLGRPDVKPAHRFLFEYEDVDLVEATTFAELQGIRPAGRASGRNLLEWPSGNFAARRGEGEMRVTPPPGVALMTRGAGASRAEPAPASPLVPRTPFSDHIPAAPVPIGGSIAYAFEPGSIDIPRGQVATDTTYVEFTGRTFNGERSSLPFHVTSSDWQESDRILAGIMTAFGRSTRAIPIGGFGTFDGTMTGAFQDPRIEGTFNGERIRAFDVVWGAVTGDVVIENAYANVKNVVISSGESTIRTDGRYAIGFPRRDGGEEINARIRINRRPVIDLRYAFGIDEYDLDGTASADLQLTGRYTAPFGSGAMRIDSGVAYGEPFEEATADLAMEGNGVRLRNIQMQIAGGQGTGAAFIDWDGTYSFNFDGAGLGVERLALTRSSTLPLSGLLDFTATGSGDFDAPRYTVRGDWRDAFVADEGIGRVTGTLSLVDGKQMTLFVNAGSPRLAVSGGGTIAVTPGMEAALTFNVIDTSLDPYIRAFQPRLSPFTTAIASGTITIQGALRDPDKLAVGATVDTLDLRLFDYQLRNEGPIRMALERRDLRISDLRFVGADTDFNLTGTVDLYDDERTDADDRRVNLIATGNANLGILQGLFRDVSSRGRATLKARLEGPLDDPVVNGTMQIDGGRIRHFGFPRSLDNIAGVLSFDTRGVRLDEVSATLGEGTVQFGGTIGIEGYQLGGVEVTMTGRDMQLRFPQGMRSRVDADIEVQGTAAGLTVSGAVRVLEARYTENFEPTSFFGTGEGGQGVAVASSSAPPVPIQLDVQISARSTVRVNNDLLRNVDGSADLRLAGTYDRPVLLGQMDIERGEISYDAKRYRILRGTIDFSNPSRIQPFLDVETEARVRVPGETYRVTVRGTGFLPEPTLSFSSEPPLPEDEIIALLAADIAPGRDVERRRYLGTPVQQQLLQQQLARGLAGLATDDVTRAAEEAIGVDLRVTPVLANTNPASTSVDPGLRFVIARQQGRVYFTYSRSTSATRDQLIQVEISQTDNMSWILSRNEDGTYALDVQIRRTF